MSQTQTKQAFAPSLMCMNLRKLDEQIDFLNKNAAMYHIDIMDGHFVPNLTLSPFFVESIAPIVKIPMDVHLMVNEPWKYFDELAKLGVKYLSPHAESIQNNAFRVINHIKALGCKVGIVVNPATPLSAIQHYAHHIDKLTLMTVDPGFAGQPFVEEVLEKIKEAKELKEKNNYKYIIEIDGSCNKNTYQRLLDAGAEQLIIGTSGLFNKDPDISKAWELMEKEFSDSITQSHKSEVK